MNLVTTDVRECRRQEPHRPKLAPALASTLDAMEVEDIVVAALCGPGMAVAAWQVATAAELAHRCAATWADVARCTRGYRKARVYKVTGEDLAYIDRVAACVTADPVDHDTIAALERALVKFQFDVVFLGTLNALKWLAKQHPATRWVAH